MLSVQPDDAFAQNGLGSALFAGKDLAGARTAFAEAVRLDPENGDYRYNLGSVLAASGEYRQALAEFGVLRPHVFGLVVEGDGPAGDAPGAVVHHSKRFRELKRAEEEDEHALADAESLLARTQTELAKLDAGTASRGPRSGMLGRLAVVVTPMPR